ncbi:flagellar basal-body rod protein FlgG [[Clostridium] polysaccharolyticum]|uniref:Flagellar basal-body rod protein FlgG n=1 Tax=[Clostridium] polysaccharolyticum TaxID=29364 RepID=A0A1I0FWY4_9FIRM|nr:flagellar basal-body rod protein FlgG [[Clostridium] polysaccharolyticum]SET62778.1 flagellar basal-body rod protein FlgG [[Clostridium] polysaccharolyticum]
MVRSLWTAASGMSAQQTYVDTISNNLSNINTTGYKKEQAEFKTLLYQNLQTKQTDNEGNPKPVSAQVGLGTRTAAITSQFTQGSLIATENKADFAIEGEGFFMVQLQDGSRAYTRNGSMKFMIGTDGLTLADSDGNLVLDSTGSPITFPEGISSSKITIDSTGRVLYPDENNNDAPTGIQIGLVQFANPAGLEKVYGSMLKETAASGTAVLEYESDGITKSKIHQGYLEASNVQAVDEMVNLIVAQRAYEMNSKAITASDEMLKQANNLRQ